MSYSQFLERAERYFIYFSLLGLLFAEALTKFGIGIPSVTLEQKIALLMFNFLLVFRIIDKRFISAPKSGTGRFSDCIDHVFSGSPKSAVIFANDATKYYQFLSSADHKIGTLTLIVHQSEDESKWHALVARGRIGRLLVISNPNPPEFHFAISDKRKGMFGLFLRGAGSIRSLGTQYFSSSTDEGKARIEDLDAVADALRQIEGVQVKGLVAPLQR